MMREQGVLCRAPQNERQSPGKCVVCVLVSTTALESQRHISSTDIHTQLALPSSKTPQPHHTTTKSWHKSSPPTNKRRSFTRLVYSTRIEKRELCVFIVEESGKGCMRVF